MVIQHLDSSGVVADTTGDCLLRWCHSIKLNILPQVHISVSQREVLPSYIKTPFQDILRPFRFMICPSLLRKLRWPSSLLHLCNLLITSVKIIMHLTRVTSNCSQLKIHGPSHIVLTRRAEQMMIREIIHSAN